MDDVENTILPATRDIAKSAPAPLGWSDVQERSGPARWRGRRGRTRIVLICSAACIAVLGGIAFIAPQRNASVHTSDIDDTAGDEAPTATVGRDRTDVSIAPVVPNTVPPAGTMDSVMSSDEAHPHSDGMATVYEVDGVQAITRISAPVLPLSAAEIRVATHVIQEGAGQPMVCTTLSMDAMIPPSCVGVPIFGLDQALLHPAGLDVSHGVLELKLDVRNQSGFRVLEAAPSTGEVGFADSDWRYVPTLPEECEPTVAAAELGAVDAYADKTGSRASVVVADRGKPVLQVLDSVVDHRAQLVRAGVPDPCVVQVPRMVSDALVLRVSGMMADEGAMLGVGTIQAGAYGRVDIYMFAVDIAAIRRIAALVDDPSIIRIVGWSVITR